MEISEEELGFSNSVKKRCGSDGVGSIYEDCENNIVERPVTNKQHTHKSGRQ
jgi:hypothetical protein